MKPLVYVQQVNLHSRIREYQSLPTYVYGMATDDLTEVVPNFKLRQENFPQEIKGINTLYTLAQPDKQV